MRHANLHTLPQPRRESTNVKRDDGHLSRISSVEFFGITIERLPLAPPVISIMETDGIMAYLRQLAKHRRKARKAGQLHGQLSATPNASSTAEDESARKTRDNKQRRLPDWLIICNCAKCRVEIAARDQPEYKIGERHRYRRIPVVAGHRDGRPYCTACLKTKFK